MNHLSLGELNALVKQTLDSNLQPSYWLVAEIGDLRVNQRGHCYLELVEKEGETLVAKAKGTIWSYTYRNLSTWFQSMTGESLQPGLKVLLNIQVQFHELYGFSLNVRDIDPNYTLGEKARKKQEVISRLVEEGVFEMNRTLPLPQVPQRIAVISSPSAAGYEDFTNQLFANPYHYQFRVDLFKAIMQGPEATASIVTALHRINNLSDRYDVMVLIRGGGSQVDLDCFDSYDLSSHLAQFPIPVITGLGHERDESIADLVAHTKMKTPTAVSEFLIQGILDFDLQLLSKAKETKRLSLEILERNKGQINELNQSLYLTSQQAFFGFRRQIDNYTTKLAYGSRARIEREEIKFRLADQTLRLIDPQMVLKRGYSITRINKKSISSIAAIATGDELSTESHRHHITSSITGVKRKND